MPISGFIGAQAADALDEVLQRRLREALRRQQEQQHQDQIAIQREQINLQAARDAQAATDRAADRAYREGQQTRQDAQALYARTDPGEINPNAASLFRQDPGLAPLVTSRKIIDARPIAGSMGVTDATGPQEFDVLEPTPAQAREQKRVVDLRRYAGDLSRAGNEQQRRTIGAQALGEGIQLPESMLTQTATEKLDAQLAQERRANTESDRRAQRDAAIQRGLITARADATKSGQANTANEYTAERARRTVQSVDNLMGRVSPWTVGRGSLLSYIPETMAADFESDLNTLKSNIAFSELAAMRAASKTGGALGAVSERELALLESTLGALSTKQSAQNFRRNLQQIKDTILRWESERRRLSGDIGPFEDFNNKIDDDAAIDARVDALLRGQ